jgi:hypothetical protein
MRRARAEQTNWSAVMWRGLLHIMYIKAAPALLCCKQVRQDEAEPVGEDDNEVDEEGEEAA